MSNLSLSFRASAVCAVLAACSQFALAGPIVTVPIPTVPTFAARGPIVTVPIPTVPTVA